MTPTDKPNAGSHPKPAVHSPMPSREAIARIIDRGAFASEAGQSDHSRAVMADDRRIALSKADQILALLPQERLPVEVEGDDGWTDWIHPLPGYRLQCCDCGLIHRMEFEIVRPSAQPQAFNTGETIGKIIRFRAARLVLSKSELGACTSAESNSVDASRHQGEKS